MTAVTGRPIFFVGTGEKVDDLEPFYPDRMAGRILGMGDVLTLIEKAQDTVDQEAAAKAAEQMLSGQFNLEDFLGQLREMRKLGPIQDLLKMLPGVPGGKAGMKELAGAIDEGELSRAEAIILSMTPQERREPGIISGSRRLRIANGSGTTTADVNTLLKDFEGARKMMRTMMGGKRVPGMNKMPRTSRRDRERTNRHGDEDPAAAHGVEGTPLLPCGGGGPAGPRDGRFIENIGKYHPLSDPSLIEIDEERALYWLRVGAQPSSQVRNLMSKVGIWETFVKERPSATVGVKTKTERPAKEKLSKKAQAKAAASSKAAAAPPAPPDEPAPVEVEAAVESAEAPVEETAEA